MAVSRFLCQYDQLLALRQVDWRSLAVVSTMPGEGRSTVVANLAVAMAMTGRRALIVDCDMRRPVHHEVFGLEASAGLADVLQGEVSQEEIVRGTAFDGLSVMPCGLQPHTPSDLLSGEAATALSQWAGANYDVVLYDTPPLSTASDGLVVASFSDAVLFVVREGGTSRLVARRCRDELDALGVCTIGAVLNHR